MSKDKKKVRFLPNTSGLIDAVSAAAEAAKIGQSTVHGFTMQTRQAERGKRLSSELQEFIEFNAKTGVEPSEETCRAFICAAIALEKEILEDIRRHIAFETTEGNDSSTGRMMALLKRSAPKKYGEVGKTLVALLDEARSMANSGSTKITDAVKAFSMAREAIAVASEEADAEIRETMASERNRERDLAAARNREEAIQRTKRSMNRLSEANSKLSSAFA